LQSVNYCKYLADFIRFPSVAPDEVIAAAGGDDEFRELDAVLSTNRGVVIVCMHFGNWDLGAGATAARGYPLTVVAETFADERLDRMVLGAREKLGMKVVKMERVGPSLLRVLKQNELLALLIDRSVPGDGVRVQFFGREVEVPAGPARLALRTGAKALPTAFPRRNPGAADVRTLCDFGVETVSTGAVEADVQTLTQAIVSAHERFIRDYPDQWYMFRPMWADQTKGARR
jgi:KDO2-lipid IV(A) lauroyltransferase